MATAKPQLGVGIVGNEKIRSQKDLDAHRLTRRTRLMPNSDTHHVPDTGHGHLDTRRTLQVPKRMEALLMNGCTSERYNTCEKKPVERRFHQAT